MSQWFEEGRNEVYVSCLRCHKTIKGTEPYSLWAHVESKRCYPECAIKGWRHKAKEKEQRAKIEEAYQATAREASRKNPKFREKKDDAPPIIYPAQPPPMRPAQVVELKGDEILEPDPSYTGC